MIFTLAALVVMSMAALAADPGVIYPTLFPNDQMAGNVLVYNIYTSSATNPTTENTRLSITNVNDEIGASVHLFFVEGATCSVADSFICLTPNQTTTILASDVDPGVTGYVVAVATDASGIPIPFGPARLIGDEYVKFASGHVAGLGAESIQADLAEISPDGDTARVLSFYLPRVLAVANIPSLTEGNDVKLIVNRIGGDLRTSASGIGSLFGLLYDELENPYSWTFSTSRCQINRSLNNTDFPRTTPRINSVIPSGSTGWMKFWGTANVGLLGSVIIQNPAASAFTTGHNLHKLTFISEVVRGETVPAAMTLTIPVFPSNCGYPVLR